MGDVLYVAAGGGGDVIGATFVHAALGGTDELHIATFSWDRLLVDPLPGPRDPSSFVDPLRVGRYNHQIMPLTRPRPPGGSTLPRLSGELPANLYLLDPRRGAPGLAKQLVELAELLGVSELTVVDVGGDILAKGDEPGLRSPLADSLVLAALADHPLPVRVIVAGAGLDGELSPEYVLQRCQHLGAQELGVIGPKDVMAASQTFEWHLSEASGLLAVAAMGGRGRAQIQAGPSVVQLNGGTTVLHGFNLANVFADAPLAQSLRGTGSLADAQSALVALGTKSELDYEHRKAEQLSSLATLDPEPLTHRVDALSEEAAAQGIDLLTLRRLAEALHLTGQAFGDFQQQLRATQVLNYAPPVWVIRSAAWPVENRFPRMKQDDTSATSLDLSRD